MMTRQSVCAGCRAPVIWRYTPSGAKMPLDAEPVAPAQGTYVIEDAVHCRQSEPMFDDPGVDHHMNHWTTCPVSDRFRRQF